MILHESDAVDWLAFLAMTHWWERINILHEVPTEWLAVIRATPSESRQNGILRVDAVTEACVRIIHLLPISAQTFLFKTVHNPFCLHKEPSPPLNLLYWFNFFIPMFDGLQASTSGLRFAMLPTPNAAKLKKICLLSVGGGGMQSTCTLKYCLANLNLRWLWACGLWRVRSP